MSENRNIANFYNMLKQKENGLRYKYQFLVSLKFNKNVFDTPIERGQYSSNDAVIFNQLGIKDWSVIDNLSDNDQNNVQECLTFFAQSAQLPQSELTTTPVTYFAQSFEFPGIVNYAKDWNVTILLDQKLTIYRYLKAWQEKMSSIVRNSGGNKTIPDARGELKLLSNDGRTTDRRYVLEGIFPTDLPAIEMRYEENGAVQTLNARFTVQYFRQVDPDKPIYEDPFEEYGTY